MCEAFFNAFDSGNCKNRAIIITDSSCSSCALARTMQYGVVCGYESGVVLRIGCDLAEVDLSIWVIEQMSNLS